jgi:non-specific serine/threonine protein kinase
MSITGLARAASKRKASGNSSSQQNMLDTLQVRGSTYSTVVDGFDPCFPTYAQQRTPIPPTDFQAVGSSWLIETDRAILGDDMGLGKCKQAIDAIMYRARYMDYCNVLVICRASNVDTWLDEIRKWANPCDLNERVHSDGLLVEVFDYRGSGRQEKHREFMQYAPNGVYATITVVAYSVLRRDVVYFVEECNFDWAIADESQEARSSPLNGNMSQTAQALLNIKTPIRHCLSGTPIMNTVADLWTQLTWLGYETRSWNDFEEQTLKVFDMKVSNWTKRKKITGVKDEGVKHLREVMSRCMLRRTKEDVAPEIPKVVYARRFVRMHPDEVAAYEKRDRSHDVAIARLREGKLTRPPDVIQGQMQRLTSSIKSKIDACVAIMEEANEAGRKVVFFTQWVQTLEMLEEALKKYNPAVVHGGVPAYGNKMNGRSARQLEVDKFQEDNNCRAFIATIQTAGVGLTLTAGSVVVLVDRPWNPKIVEQAVDRVRRIGQLAQNILVYSLYAVIPAAGGKFTHTMEMTTVNEALSRKTKDAGKVIA